MHNVGHFRQGRYCSLWLLEPRLQCKKWTMLCVIFSFALNHHICLCWCCSLGFEMRHHYYQIGKRFLMLWGYINPHLSQHCRWLFGTQQHQSVLYSKLKSSSINFTKLRLLDFLGFINVARVIQNVQKSNFLKIGGSRVPRTFILLYIIADSWVPMQFNCSSDNYIANQL